MLDKYLWCSVERISPEAPIPIAKFERESSVPGGAANTANNLSSLGAQVEIIGVVGQDLPGGVIIDHLKQSGVRVGGITFDTHRSTTVKTRIMVGHHHMLRLDNDETTPINAKTENELLMRLFESLQDAHMFVISDYNKGLISDNLARKSIAFANKRGIRVLVDPIPSNFLKYRNVYMIKPNKREAEEIVGFKMATDYSNLPNISKKITSKLGAKVIMVTLGKDGIAIFDSNDGTYRIPCIDYRQAVDVSGAGDTTMAGISISLGSGASLREAATLANICAGISVSKPGTSTCSKDELLDYVNKFL